MTFFESLLVLLLAAVVLLQVARRTSLPYPTLLAAAGVGVAMIPGAPNFPIDPGTALALFIAPVLLDSAYDFPPGAAIKLWLPLFVYAVIAVLVTAAVVAGIGVAMLGLPIAAALALGAIVAPPDAAAAAAVLTDLPVSRRIDAVLKGEAMFNDATALLLFTAALTFQAGGGVDTRESLMLLAAAPGGILFGWLYGLLARRLSRLVENSVGGTLLQFLQAYLVWIIAEHLHLSAVLATVTAAMTVAARADVRDSPRMRVHSYAVWTTVVFLLNVLAFLLMGMQARRIVGGMDPAELTRAGWFAGAVVLGVIGTRLVIAFGLRFAVHLAGREQRVTPTESLLVGWAGMRGLITLATAYALPGDFPQRDTLVLAALAVVLATLVIQGATLAPMIRFFKLGRQDDAEREMSEARHALAGAALARLADEPGDEAAQLRQVYQAFRTAEGGGEHRRLDHRRGLSLAAVFAQRRHLEELRADHRIGPDAYLQLQEDLDWKQLSILADEDRRIEEG